MKPQLLPLDRITYIMPVTGRPLRPIWAHVGARYAPHFQVGPTAWVVG